MVKFDDNRLYHSLAVARKMKELVLDSNPDDVEFAHEMFVLGMIHDIGYEFVEDQKDHERLGGELLKNMDFKYWKEIYWHGNPKSPYTSRALDILNIADNSISPDGKPILPSMRLSDIENRYGKDSVQAKNAQELMAKLKLL